MGGPINRRVLLSGMAGAAAAPAMAQVAVDQPGRPLAPWRPGGLDIHHIATGQGDCALVIGPDGTSLMIDAGATAGRPPAALPIRPGPERRAGEWIARYASRQLAAAGRRELDYLLVTHLHPDHLGDVTPESPAGVGGYRLTGVADVADALPVGLIVDRGFPDYSYPRPWKAAFAENYQAFIRHRTAGGGRVERFRVGAADQFRLLRQPQRHRGFEIRNLAANGQVWGGDRTGVVNRIPPLSELLPADMPDENLLSAAIRLRFGSFEYFAAGDLTGSTFDGALPWRDVETAAAQAAGAVEVAVAPHHGMFDASTAGAVRALRPRIWIVQGWHAAHPSVDAMERLFSQRLYPGPRDVFATGVTGENALVNARLVDRMRSRDGHVVVRVTGEGSEYTVVVTSNLDEGDRVQAVFGPFPCLP